MAGNVSQTVSHFPRPQFDTVCVHLCVSLSVCLCLCAALIPTRAHMCTHSPSPSPTHKGTIRTIPRLSVQTKLPHSFRLRFGETPQCGACVFANPNTLTPTHTITLVLTRVHLVFGLSVEVRFASCTKSSDKRREERRRRKIWYVQQHTHSHNHNTHRNHDHNTQIDRKTACAPLFTHSTHPPPPLFIAPSVPQT